MPVHRPGSPRPRRAFLAGALIAVCALVPITPASAAESPDATASATAGTTPNTPVTPTTPARGTARMGMGVAAHDGQDGLPTGTRAAQTEGVDVASYQGNVSWTTLWNSGVRWSYNKASEGTYYTNPYFSQQYTGAYGVGMIRGAYHFATPDTTSGATQANYFVDHGGGWSADGRTLPGTLDIEWNPYGDTCYGKSTSGMVSWIRDFLNQYKARTGRNAVIYTSTTWWSQCTGNYAGFSANPLWIARYASTAGTLPAGWSTYTMWQYTSSGPTVGDHDKFNGALDRVQALAKG
ncbi:lysozyme [Streptomyces griseorubiginosus]|uniref:lysozyme n=1 Tax=Streptomyces griseorubiginosus TaxID=67304 RepID=UPI003455CE73